MCAESESTQRDRIQRAVDHIEAHLTDELGMAVLAEVACYSPSRFQQLFHQHVGVPVRTYIRERRLSEAKRDLAGNAATDIGALAARYGYRTAQAFIRAFTRFHGMSPTEYRLNHPPARVRHPASVSSPPPDIPRLSEAKMRAHRKTTWEVTLELDMPELTPEVVQFALFDTDPALEYERELTNQRRRASTKTITSIYEDPQAALRHALDMRKCILWNRLFMKVTGHDVYLLVGNTLSDAMFSISSNATGKIKWLATRTYGSPSSPMCWCVPFEARAGSSVSVTLDRYNVLDLNALFEAYSPYEP